MAFPARRLSGIASVAAWLAWVPVALLLTACTGITLDPRPPSDFDLTGTWRLLEGESDTAPSRRRLRSRGGMLSFVTQDFPVLRAQELRIEQSRDSMGIRYDGKDYRDVSWGDRRRGLWEVEAGWYEGSLVILSEARDAKARETLTLSADGQRLKVDVEVHSGDDDVVVTRTFRRH